MSEVRYKFSSPRVLVRHLVRCGGRSQNHPHVIGKPSPESRVDLPDVAQLLWPSSGRVRHGAPRRSRRERRAEVFSVGASVRALRTQSIGPMTKPRRDYGFRSNYLVCRDIIAVMRRAADALPVGCQQMHQAAPRTNTPARLSRFRVKIHRLEIRYPDAVIVERRRFGERSCGVLARAHEHPWAETTVPSIGDAIRPTPWRRCNDVGATPAFAVTGHATRDGKVGGAVSPIDGGDLDPRLDVAESVTPRGTTRAALRCASFNRLEFQMNAGDPHASGLEAQGRMFDAARSVWILAVSDEAARSRTGASDWHVRSF